MKGDSVTCLVCGREFEKEIAAAWHEDQTGHDKWSDADESGETEAAHL